MSATTPRWLDAYTTATGLPDPRLAGTTARPRHCDTCRLVVLAGYDAPLCAGLAITDPYLLTPRLEAAAVILTRPTYRLWGYPGSWQLLPRHRPDVHPIVRHPPAGPDVHVLAAHRCGTPPLSRIHLPAPGAHHWPGPNDTPPF